MAAEPRRPRCETPALSSRLCGRGCPKREAFWKWPAALTWIPSDVDPGQRDSIAAWRRESGLKNFAAPLAIDVAAPWPLAPGHVQAVLTINLLHLIPGPFMSRLFEEARAALSEGGRLIVYGPFLRGSIYASEGDCTFDASLRARDPAIGYKSVEAVSDAALAAGLDPVATDAMPANNLLLTFAALRAPD